MMTFILTLAIASLIAEMTLAWKLRLWRRLASRSVLANAFMSLLLSYLLSGLFGANGVVLLAAALLTTALSIVGCWLMSLLHRDRKPYPRPDPSQSAC